MFTLAHLIPWLITSGLLSTGLMATGYLLARWCGPKRVKLRLLQWTLCATVAGLTIIAVPRNWRVTLPVAVLPAAEVEGLRQTLSVDPSAELTPIDQDLTTQDPAGQRMAEPTIMSADAERETALPTVANNNVIKHATTPKMVSATSQSSWKDWCQHVTAGLFLLGGLVVLGRWCYARYQLHKLFVHSLEVPKFVSAELHALAGFESRHVRLRTSPHIVSPITWGIVKPIIMLPSSLVDAGDRQSLRFSLAHEWAHVSGRDSGTWLIVNCLQCLLYYNPLYWLLRRQLLLTMDQLADAHAAECGESPADYAAFLVQLARAQQRQSPRLALAVSDPHSLLRKRVEFLIEHNPLSRLSCSWTQHALIAIGAVLLVLASTAIKLQPRTTINAQEQQAASAKPNEAKPNGEPTKTDDATKKDELPDAAITDIAKRIVNGAKPSIGELIKAAVQERPDGSIVYHGFVLDRETGLPIADAKVLVHHKLSRDPKTGDWSTLEVTEHLSNLLGMYSFTLPPEQTAQSSLYIEVEAHHPQYASKGRSGYSHDMIRTNLKLGELPFYTEIKLWPGTPVEGTLVSPDGQPVEGVEVSIYAKSSKVTGMMGGSFAKVKSDSQGRFRIIPPTPGDGVLWIKPDKFAPQAHRLADRRGDWGKIMLAKGTDVPGQILDVDGRPVPNVRIEARRRGDGEKADEFLKENAVAGGIRRQAVSDEQGRFTLWALPEGDYTATVESNSDSYDPPPLEQVFLFQSFKLSQEKAEPLTIRAIPFVVLHGTYLNSQDKPTSGHEVRAWGKLDGKFYSTMSNNAGKDGKFELKLPHGLQETKLDLITNEHSALKWRKSRDKPLQRGRNVTIGTVEDDIAGFEIVRYTAPILLVKAVDSSGKVIDDAVPIIAYTRPADSEEEMVMYTTGSRVSFENQGDGYHRSSQLLPDEPISVTFNKEGFTTTPRELKLAEGEEQKLEFVLVPAEKKAEEK